MRDILIHFLDRIREYEHESGHSMYQDERESDEIVDIYLQDEQLHLHSVSISLATEYAKFCVRCDRKNIPLIDLEGYLSL